MLNAKPCNVLGIQQRGSSGVRVPSCRCSCSPYSAFTLSRILLKGSSLDPCLRSFSGSESIEKASGKGVNKFKVFIRNGFQLHRASSATQHTELDWIGCSERYYDRNDWHGTWTGVQSADSG